MTAAFPLEGLRVVDLSRVLAGPFATMLLADLGADVVKVEPPDGDETRAWGPPWWGDPTERRSAYFASVNRNKRSVVVDLRADAGRATLERLLARGDLLVHNYRPATADRLGLDADGLAHRHPHLVVASVGGFPGSDADRPAYDLLAQAVSGLMHVTGAPDGPPTKVGVAVLDLIAGLECAVGALAALLGRTGSGGRPVGPGGGPAVRRVEVGLIEAGVTSLVNVLGNLLAGGSEPMRTGNAHPNIVPYEAFAADGGELVIAVGNDAQFARLLDVLGLPSDPEWATNPQRIADRQRVVAAIRAAVGERDHDELLAALRAADVPAGPVSTVGEALTAMERTRAEGWTTTVDGIRLAPSPIRVDGRSLPPRRPPPGLGEHTDEIVAELENALDD